jgi:membrane-bound serine protease (ClpP class)
LGLVSRFASQSLRVAANRAFSAPVTYNPRMTIDYLSLAVLLFALGLVLFVAEYFLPTGGFLIVFGVLLCVAAVGIIAKYGSQIEAVAAIVALCIGVPLAGTGGFYFWGRRMALRTSDDPATDLSGASDLADLKGRFGVTASQLKPSGIVDFDGRRIDAVTEGPMLDAGVSVRCLDVRGGKVIVRHVPKPADLSDLNFDELK